MGFFKRLAAFLRNEIDGTPEPPPPRVRRVPTGDGLSAFIADARSGGGSHVEVGFPRRLGLVDLGVDESNLEMETHREEHDDGSVTVTTIGRDANGVEVLRRVATQRVTSTTIETGSMGDVHDAIQHMLDDRRGDRRLDPSPIADALAAFLEHHPNATIHEDHIEIDVGPAESAEAILEAMASAAAGVAPAEPPPAPPPASAPPPPPPPAPLDLREASVLGALFDTDVSVHERSTSVTDRYLGQSIEWDATVERDMTLRGRREVEVLLGHLGEGERYSDRVRAIVHCDEQLDLDRGTTIIVRGVIGGVDIYTRRLTILDADIEIAPS